MEKQINMLKKKNQELIDKLKGFKNEMARLHQENLEDFKKAAL